jgi:hypothetical protein
MAAARFPAHSEPVTVDVAEHTFASRRVKIGCLGQHN